MDAKQERYLIKRKRINLDLAKEGAVRVLEHANMRQWSLAYKETVRLLFLLNQEMDERILDGNPEMPMLAGELEIMTRISLLLQEMVALNQCGL